MEGEIEPQEPEAVWQSLRSGEYDEDDLHLGKDEVALLSDMFQVCLEGRTASVSFPHDSVPVFS